MRIEVHPWRALPLGRRTMHQPHSPTTTDFRSPAPLTPAIAPHLDVAGSTGALLSEGEVRFFRHAGYLRLRDHFSERDLAILRGVVDAEIASEAPPVRRNAAGTVTRLSRIYNRHWAFTEALTAPFLLGALSSLLGPNIELLLNRHNHATTNVGDNKAHRLHRDILQWSRSATTALIYLDDSLPENGCTTLVPASHYLPFVAMPNNGGTWMDEHAHYAPFLDQGLLVPMPAGSVLLFDCLLFHAAGVNRGAAPRRVLSAAYHSVDELTQHADDPHRALVLGARIYKGDS